MGKKSHPVEIKITLHNSSSFDCLIEYYVDKLLQHEESEKTK